MSLPQKAVGLLIRGSRISLINGRTPQLTAGMRFLSCSDCRSRCHLISLGETDGRENPGSASGPSLNVASGAPASTSDVIQYAASCHRLGSKDGLDNLVRLIMVDGGARVPVPHRTLYFAMDLALNLKCTELAAKLSSLMPQKVNVLATSLRIRLLSQQERTREALSQIELVLNEDKPALDVSIKIANEALDDLCGAIKRTSDRVEQMRRFRYLQRLCAKYNRRTFLSIKELLYSPMVSIAKDDVKEEFEEQVEAQFMDKIVKIAPHILAYDTKP